MGLYQSDFGAAPFLRPEFQSADGLSLQCKDRTQNEESFWVHLRVELFCSLGRIYLRLRDRVIPSGEYLREKRILGIGSPNYPPIKTVGNIEDVVFGIRELRKKREGGAWMFYSIRRILPESPNGQSVASCMRFCRMH